MHAATLSEIVLDASGSLASIGCGAIFSPIGTVVAAIDANPTCFQNTSIRPNAKMARLVRLPDMARRTVRHHQRIPTRTRRLHCRFEGGGRQILLFFAESTHQFRLGTGVSPAVYAATHSEFGSGVRRARVAPLRERQQDWLFEQVAAFARSAAGALRREEKDIPHLSGGDLVQSLPLRREWIVLLHGVLFET